MYSTVTVSKLVQTIFVRSVLANLVADSFVDKPFGKRYRSQGKTSPNLKELLRKKGKSNIRSTYATTAQLIFDLFFEMINAIQ